MNQVLRRLDDEGVLAVLRGRVVVNDLGRLDALAT